MKLVSLAISILFFLNCGLNVAKVENEDLTASQRAELSPMENKETKIGKADANAPEPESIAVSPNQEKQPKTVRDFFNLLPFKYFTFAGCDTKSDKNCEKARKEYVSNYLEVEDTANGYWKSGCDGAQSCLEMALFKRPNGTYIVAVHTSGVFGEENYFLDYKAGKWTDISAQVIPQFSKKNAYELPRKGTTIKVFKKNYPEPNISERGEKIYDLVWRNGKFTIRK